MSRLIKKASLTAIRSFIEKYNNNGGQSSFSEFRTAFANDYSDEIKKYPLFDVEINESGYEGGYGLGLLEELYSGNLVYELDNSDNVNEIEEDLTNEYLKDIWIEIRSHYATK